MSVGKLSSFSINNSFVIGVVLPQFSLISFIFTATKPSQVEKFWMCLMVPRLLERRWYELKKKYREGGELGFSVNVQR